MTSLEAVGCIHFFKPCTCEGYYGGEGTGCYWFEGLLGYKVVSAQCLNQLWGHLATDALVIEVYDEDFMGDVPPLGLRSISLASGVRLEDGEIPSVMPSCFIVFSTV